MAIALATIGSSIGALMKNIFINSNKVGKPITAITNQATIISRVFIDGSIVTEDVITNILKSTHKWYCAQIIAAFHLEKFVVGDRTVSDLMRPLQSGAAHTNPLNKAIDRKNRLASFAARSGGKLDWTDPELQNMENEFQGEAGKKKEVKVAADSVKSLDVGDNKIGPFGELLEIKFASPENPSAPVTVPVFVQMAPSLISAEAAPRFIDMNVSPSLWTRWTQMTAGEISFFKDFLFFSDITKRSAEIFKDPETREAFKEFTQMVGQKDRYSVMEAASNPAKYSKNLANSVIILSSDTVERARVESGINLYHDMDSYFKQTYAMMVVIVDPSHQRVSVHFNGIRGEINVPYSDFKPSKKGDQIDFTALVQAIASNNLSRMR